MVSSVSFRWARKSGALLSWTRSAAHLRSTKDLDVCTDFAFYILLNISSLALRLVCSSRGVPFAFRGRPILWDDAWFCCEDEVLQPRSLVLCRRLCTLASASKTCFLNKRSVVCGSACPGGIHPFAPCVLTKHWGGIFGTLHSLTSHKRRSVPRHSVFV